MVILINQMQLHVGPLDNVGMETTGIAVGSILAGRFRLDRFVGGEDQGRVYAAYDSKLNLDVALRVLPDDLARDPGYLERLEREASMDESAVALLDDVDHIRRQMRLVAMQRSDALRMRLFLDRSSGSMKQSPLLADRD